jgi:hypothetical protein
MGVWARGGDWSESFDGADLSDGSEPSKEDEYEYEHEHEHEDEHEDEHQ